MTSVVDTTVKYLSSDMPGAPVLAGQVGSLVSLLDAVLVNGFGAKTLTSLVVSGGIATASFSGTHPAIPESVIEISGVTGSLTALNGEQKVTAIGVNTVQFATAAANGSATGTISMKMAPVGWGIAFTGTNLRAYRSNDVTSNRRYLRVNDTNALDARVVGYETMTAISTGTNLFPTNAQLSGGGYWIKAVVANSDPIPWMIFGNGKRFQVWIAAAAGATYSAGAYDVMTGRMFGDFQSWKATADTYNTLLMSATSVGAMYPSLANTYVAPGDGSFAIARLHTNAVGAVFGQTVAAFSANGSAGGYDGVMGPLEVISNQLILASPMVAASANTYGMRGALPEVFHPTGTVPSTWTGMTKGSLVVHPVTSRKLVVVPGASSIVSSDNGSLRACTLVDVTGPWA